MLIHSDPSTRKRPLKGCILHSTPTSWKRTKVTGLIGFEKESQERGSNFATVHHNYPRTSFRIWDPGHAEHQLSTVARKRYPRTPGQILPILSLLQPHFHQGGWPLYHLGYPPLIRPSLLLYSALNPLNKPTTLKGLTRKPINSIWPRMTTPPTSLPHCSSGSNPIQPCVEQSAQQHVRHL